LILLLLSLGLEPLLAQTVEEPPATTLHDEVVVTANRVEEKFDEVAGNVTVFTRQDIEQSASQTLDEFLRQVPGFSLFRRSSSLVAHPTTQGVSLRGISPSGVSRTLVLLDGVPVNDPFGGWVYWSRIPLESIEQIEILRGGGSNVWGNYALGGVINIATRQITDDRLAASVEVGNQNDLLVDIFGGRRGERLGWSIEGGYFQTDGYEIVREDQRGPIDIEAFSKHLYLSPKIEYELSPRAKLLFHGSYFEEDRGNGTPLTNNDTEAGQLGVAGEFNTVGGSAWHVSLFARDQTFASTFSAQETDRSSERPALDQFAVDASDLGGSAQWTKKVVEKHLLTAGADLRWVDGQTNEDFFWDGTSFL
jgi:outer membrane cobalamin receptor